MALLDHDRDNPFKLRPPVTPRAPPIAVLDLAGIKRSSTASGPNLEAMTTPG